MQSLAEVLEGRHALVTGGSRGIGRATAAALAAAGARVTIVARGEKTLARCAQVLGVEARVADVADEASLSGAADGSRRVRNTTDEPGRRLIWATWPSTQTQPSLAIQVPTF